MSRLKQYAPVMAPSFELTAGGAKVQGGSLAGLGLVRMARAIYDFSVDGGVTGLITPAKTATLPDNAIILGGLMNSTTAVTSLGSATLATGTSAGSAANSLKTATAKATLSLDALLDLVPVWTAATAVKLTAAGVITFTIGTADLTAGVVEVTVFYIHAAN